MKKYKWALNLEKNSKRTVIKFIASPQTAQQLINTYLDKGYDVSVFNKSAEQHWE